MSVILVQNIKKLIGVRSKNRLLRGNHLAELPVLDNAYLIVEDGLIAAFGKMEDLKPKTFKQTIDATDHKSGTAEFKATAVRVEPVDAAAI